MMLRYTIEAKDEFGWFDYAIVIFKHQAVNLAKELKESFGGDVKVIDKQIMIEIEIVD